jgi:murein DD-endopeptidase MepM/ murein hydrolase activator NlpD
MVSNEDLIEYEGYDDDVIGESELAETSETTEVAEVEVPDAVETAGTTVQADIATAIGNLSFQKDNGLLWPVMGNVLMNYSMEHTIYHATLMQYKCNPAIIIDAEVGTEVKAAATGIVSDIETDNEETGLTVTMSIGDGYSLVYGQLDNLSLAVGDSVNEGEVIGTVQEPTKYYTVEGSNLYFKVMENDQTVNPMLLLR